MSKQSQIFISKTGLQLKPPTPSNDNSYSRPKPTLTLNGTPKRGYRGKNQIFNTELSGGEDLSDEEYPTLQGKAGDSVTSASNLDQDEIEDSANEEEEEVEEEEDEIIHVPKKQINKSLNAKASGSGTRNGVPQVKNQDEVFIDDSENDDLGLDWGSPIEEEQFSSSPSKPFLGSNTTPPAIAKISSDDLEEEDPVKIISRSSKKKRVIVEEIESEGEESEDEVRNELLNGKKALPFLSQTASKRLNNSRSLSRQSSYHSNITTQSDDELIGKRKFAIIICSPRKKVQPIVITDTEEEEDSEPIRRSSPIKKPLFNTYSSKSKSKAEVLVIDSDSDESLPKSKPKYIPKSKRQRQSSSEEEEEAVTPAKRHIIKVAKKAKRQPEIVQKIVRRKPKARVRKLSEVDSDSSSVQYSPRKKAKPIKKQAPSQALGKIIKKAIARESAEEDSSEDFDFIDDEDEDMLGSNSGSHNSDSKNGRSKGKKKNQEKKKKKKDVKGKGKARKVDTSELSSDGEHDNVEFDDEDNDLEIPGRKIVIKSRFRNKPKKSKFDLLRAARLENKSGGSKGKPNFEGDDREEESEEDSEEGSEEESASQTGSEDNSEDSDESLKGMEDFIAEDENEGLNAEQQKEATDTRLAFSNESQGLPFYLKTFIQWIIREIVCPEIDWLENVKDYETSHAKCTRHFKGLVQSLIGSSAWRIPFKRAVDALPTFSLSDLPLSERGAKCDACTSGVHRHSTFKLELQGDAYDDRTLKSKDGFSDDSETDDSSSSDVSAKAPFVREFNLGANCAGRAQTYSELLHFGHHIYDEVYAILADKRNLVRKMSLPNTATIKERHDEQKRRAKFNEHEGARLTKELDEDGTIERITKDWIKKSDNAKRDFADQKG